MTVNILRKDEKKTECRAKSETLCTATFTGKKKKKYNKRGEWHCGLPQLVSTFLADNKACLCLDELL